MDYDFSLGNPTELKSLSTNSNRNHGKNGTTESSSTNTRFNHIPHKYEHNTNQGNENMKDNKGNNNIDIRVQQFCENTKASPSKDGSKHQDKGVLDCNLDSLSVKDDPIVKGRSNKTDKRTISKVNTSKTKKPTLEVEWTHLKTPPRDRKLVAKSSSQNSRSDKNVPNPISSHSNPLEKPNRKIAQKARTTNLALSMKIAQSVNISHRDAKHERETEEDRRPKGTNRRGSCD